MLSVPPLPLFRPRRYFRERGEAIPLTHALVAVAINTAVVTLAVVGIGDVIVETVDPSVTVENPDRPPSWACETMSSDGESTTSAEVMMTPSGCAEPEEVPARSVLRDAVTNQLGFVVVAIPIGWLLVTGLVHVLSRLAGGSGSVGTTAGVVGVASLPSAVQAVAAYAGLRLLLADRTVTEVDRLATVVRDAAGHPLLVAVVVLGTAWSAAMVYAGLRESRGHDAPAAAAIAGLLWLIGVAASL